MPQLAIIGWINALKENLFFLYSIILIVKVKPHECVILLWLAAEGKREAQNSYMLGEKMGKLYTPFPKGVLYFLSKMSPKNHPLQLTAERPTPTTAKESTISTMSTSAKFRQLPPPAIIHSLFPFY